MTRNVSLYAGATITEATFPEPTTAFWRPPMEFRASTTQVVTYSEIRTGAGFGLEDFADCDVHG